MSTRLLEPQALARSFEQFVATCEDTCAGEPGPDCSIIIDLGRRRFRCAPADPEPVLVDRHSLY